MISWRKQNQHTIYHRKKGEQVERFQQAFILIDMPINVRKCQTDNMLEECNNIIQSKNVIDHYLYSIVLAITHYNQASYRWLHTLSSKLGYIQIKENLDQNILVEQDFTQKINGVMSYNL